MIAGFDGFTVAALVLGVVWITLNLYIYAPLYRGLTLEALGRPNGRQISDRETDLTESALPTIDILLPAYQEAETIGYSIRALRDTDYPQEKVAISVLVESDDRTTRDELARLHRLYDFAELVIPPSFPGERNKPRALLYGYEHTDGDIVGVIDAEDIVDPTLLKQITAALVDDDHDFAQGRLDMQNENDGILNTIFRGEYGLWYRFVIPNFRRVGYPVPLGGTTNFFHRSVLDSAASDRTDRFGSPWTPEQRAALEEMGYRTDAPWDPRNVTEDFELGLLLWEEGYSLGMVAATTMSESPIGLNGWIRQRTRWQKGKLYTFYGRLRNRPAGLRRLVHVSLQSGIPHLGPVNIFGVVLLAMYANIVGLEASPIVAGVLLVGAAFIVQQTIIQALAYAAVTDSPDAVRAQRIVLNVLGLPFYWLLLWGSDLRAIIQLAFDHSHWEKTVHLGRHILTTETADTDGAAGSESFAVFLSETEDGWHWEIHLRDTPIARSAEAVATEAAARAGLRSFIDTIPIAVDDGFLFYVQDEERGWTWTFDGPDQRVRSPEHFPDTSTTLATVGRTKIASGIALLDRSRSSSRPVQGVMGPAGDDQLVPPVVHVEGSETHE